MKVVSQEGGSVKRTTGPPGSYREAPPRLQALLALQHRPASLFARGEGVEAASEGKGTERTARGARSSWPKDPGNEPETELVALHLAATFRAPSYSSQGGTKALPRREGHLSPHPAACALESPKGFKAEGFKDPSRGPPVQATQRPVALLRILPKIPSAGP